MSTASLRALLAKSIDYAGLFPPASLTLAPALQSYAEYIRTPEAWMLSTFVLPAEQFREAATKLAQFDEQHPLQISALGARTNDRSAFVEALKTAALAIASFAGGHARGVRIGQLEMPLPPEPDDALFVEAASILGETDVQAFWEAPARVAETTVAAIAEHNAETAGRPFGYKLRTGGTEAKAFPNSAALARALVAAARCRVPIKFTAGLHHPVRKFHSSVNTKMHGFLNVLGAGVLTLEHGWDEEQTAAMLEDEDPTHFSFHDDAFSWCEWKVATRAIEEHRRLVTSLGSCSFDEPREDLRTLRLF